MENKKQYIIIDEPQLKPWSRSIVNPIIILFAAMIVPLLWNPPFFGRFWMPFVWLFINGLMLGSPTLKREVLYMLSGLLIMGGLFSVMYYIFENNIQFEFSMLRYLGVMLNAVLFLSMYLVVFQQSVAYEIYEYTKEHNS